MPLTFTAKHEFDMTFEGQTRHYGAGLALSTEDPCRMLAFIDAFRDATKEGVGEEWEGVIKQLEDLCPRGAGAPRPSAPAEVVTVTPPVETRPEAGDSPNLQGAPDVESPAVVEYAPPDTQITPQQALEIYWGLGGPSAPRPAEEIISLVSPPPPKAIDFDALVRQTLRNERPGQSHPSHSAPTTRTPAVVGDPVDLFAGAFTINVVDLIVPTPHLPIAMSRTYRSGRPYYGPHGFGWDHVYNVYLRELTDGSVALWAGQLHEEHFRAVGGEFEPEPGFAARLERNAGVADVYEVHFPGGLIWQFERPAGWSDVERIPLTTIRDRHGNAVQLGYGPLNRVVSVLDAAGRGLLFHYGSCELLERVTDHNGTRAVRYEHDPEIEQLVRVILPPTAQYPKGISTTYEYDRYASHPAMQHNILRIRDAEDRLMVENEFAGPEAGWEFNSVVRQRVAGFEYQFEYQQIQYVPPDPEYVDVLAARTLVRSPDGSLHTYTFNYRGDMLDYRCRLSRDGSFRVISSQWAHDAEGNVTETVGPDGLRTIYTYDANNPDPCARRNLRRVELAAPLSGSVPSRLLYQAQYEPRFQLATRTEDEIGAETRFFYDLDLKPVGATGRLSRTELPAVIGADGVPQQSILLFEHNAHGQLTATIKPEGGRTELTYIAGGLQDHFLSEITVDPGAARLVTKFEYDVAGFPKQVQTPGGRMTGFTHNTLGQVEEIVAPEVAGQRAQFRRWFDDSGSIVRLERPAGSFAAALIQGTSIVDEYERDEVGNLRRATLAGNTDMVRKWLHCVDHEGRPVSIWDPLGMRINRVFGENGALLSETAAAGESIAQKTAYFHDRAGRVKRVVGPWKDVTTFEYDVWGRPHRITLPSGAVRTLEFGANDRLLEDRIEEKMTTGLLKPRLLRQQTYEYDRRGRLISTTLLSFRDDPATAAPLKTRHLYDRDDHVRALLLPRGAQHRYDFDVIGRLTGMTDPHGNVRRLVYDASGDIKELTTIEVENGVTRTTTRSNIYDERGRLKQSEYLGRIARIQYDDRDLPIEQTAPSGVTSRLQFDAHGQVIENLIDPDGVALRSRFEYDLSGRLRRYSDPTGQSTIWERDALGRAIAIKPPDGTTWESLIDINARTIEQRMPSGNKVLFEYGADASGPVKMMCVAAPGQEAVEPHELVYDGMGRLLRATSGADSILRSYDSLGRLMEEIARGKTVRMEYNDLTGSTDFVFPDGRRERTEHNPAAQPTRVLLVTPGALGGNAGDVLLEIIYSTAGRPVGMLYGNGVEGQLVHDDLGRVIRIEYRKGGVLLDSCRLRYDEGGHRAIIQYLGLPARNLVHRFDGHERLVEARSGFALAPLADLTTPAAQAADVAAARIAAANAPGVAFSLDDADARTKVTGLNGGAADEVHVSANDHRVTAVGASTISYNADGHRLGDARYEYELDALNRVSRVRDRVTKATLAELSYDALSRVSAGATDGQAFERWFAGSARIQEISGAGNARQHSPHPLWPTPFCVVDATGPAFIHQDEGWSTMCVSDASGAVLERHRYDVFGASATLGADGVTPLASLRVEPMWRGMPALGTTRLFQTPQRLYDPETGVFTSRDPLLYVDSPSPYVYAAHNPVDFADPTGFDKSSLGSGAPSNAAAASPRTGVSKWLYEKSKTTWWYDPPYKGDILQQTAPVDSGSTAENLLWNGFIGLSNLAARAANTSHNLDALVFTGIERLVHITGMDEVWQAAQVMAPMESAMGLEVEVAPAVEYAIGWLATNRRVNAVVRATVLPIFGGVSGPGGGGSLPPLPPGGGQRGLGGLLQWIITSYRRAGAELRRGRAEANVWEMVPIYMGAKGGPGGFSAVRAELEWDAKTSSGRRKLEEMLNVLPSLTVRNEDELDYLRGMDSTIRSVLDGR